MGTDIHLYVERRENGAWKSCDTWEDCDYVPDRRVVNRHFYSSRSYDTFAILANVRNGRGFAGVDTGDGFVPIAEPRGLPGDLSPEMQLAAESCDHTPSWLTLRELMDYDWTRRTTKRGWITGLEYHRWSLYSRQRTWEPQEYCGGVAGGRVEHLTEDQMIHRIAAIRERVGDNYAAMHKAVEQELRNSYCQVSWTTPYYRAAAEFLSECLPRLWRLGSPDDVRIVFWFDS